MPTTVYEHDNIDRSIIILYTRIYTANQRYRCVQITHITLESIERLDQQALISCMNIHQVFGIAVKTCVKRPLIIRQNKDLNDKW